MIHVAVPLKEGCVSTRAADSKRVDVKRSSSVDTQL